MKVLIVRMPATSARDKVAISVELAGHSQEMADADLVIGTWPDDWAYVMKDRPATGTGEVTIVNAASTHAIEQELNEGVMIKINRLGFKIKPGHWRGSDIRGLPTPPIPETHDLFFEQTSMDLLVHPDGTYDLQEGAVLFSAPKAILDG